MLAQVDPSGRRPALAASCASACRRSCVVPCPHQLRKRCTRLRAACHAACAGCRSDSLPAPQALTMRMQAPCRLDRVACASSHCLRCIRVDCCCRLPAPRPCCEQQIGTDHELIRQVVADAVRRAAAGAGSAAWPRTALVQRAVAAHAAAGAQRRWRDAAGAGAVAAASRCGALCSGWPRRSSTAATTAGCACCGNDGSVIFERESPERAGAAPRWFAQLLPVSAEPGVAQVSDGSAAAGHAAVV